MKNVLQNNCIKLTISRTAKFEFVVHQLLLFLFDSFIVALLCCLSTLLHYRWRWCFVCVCVCFLPYDILYLPRKLIVISWRCRYSYSCCIFNRLAHTFFVASFILVVLIDLLYVCKTSALLLLDYYENFRIFTHS